MSLFHNLLRNSFFDSLALNALRGRRPKVSARTLRKRKEKKRMKYINQYSAEYTGEKPLNPWMDPKKLKALFLSHQDVRNTHRFNRNIAEKDRSDIVEKSCENADYNYHKLQSEALLEYSFARKICEATKEAEKLPYYLRDELGPKKKGRKIQNITGESHHFLTLYYPQLLRVLPDELADRMIVGKRLEKIANDKLEMGE